VTRPLVSVVVPAFNAEPTLAVALDSLAAQTQRDWEAIVVDDGSTDATAALVARRAAADPRLRLVRQANGGVSAARNAGIALARAPWLAFLDADDWLVPEAFETLLDALRARPELDGVHCGWTRIAPDGREAHEICPCDDERMFAWHAHNCGFAIHAVMVRRELVERAGGFDPSLTTCEDWDLWMRLSRLGARWRRIDAQLASYRIRELSASMAARRLLLDGLVVIDRAHGRDPRLDGQAHERPQGAEAGLRARARLVHAAFSAGLAAGQGHDAVALLDPVAGDRFPELGAEDVAYALYEGVPLGVGTVPSDWAAFPADLLERLSDLLAALERIAGAPQLARRTKRMLERLVSDDDDGHPAAMWERIEAVAVQLVRPLSDVAVGATTERLLVMPRYGEFELDRIELPAADGCVPAELIADAVAAEHAWDLLGAFLRASVAPGLDHDADGWELLLQELFGAPQTPNAAFYDADFDDQLEPAATVRPRDGWAAVELSAPLPQLDGEAPVRVVATIGGATLGAFELAPSEGRVAAGALRREICTQGGFELCRLAVRQGVVGRAPDDGARLRERLASSAAALRGAPSIARLPDGVVPAARAAGCEPPVAGPPAAAGLPDGCALAPGWERHAARALGARDGAWLIPRRRGARTGLAGSRVALLPRLAAAEAITGARAAGEPVIALGAPGGDAPALYVPDIVWRDAGANGADGAGGRPGAPAAAEPAAPVAAAASARATFEALFAARPDPWRYTSAYEQGKYEQTLALAARSRSRRALELGCAEGHFTHQLAPRVGSLRACDISLIALDRARRRCAGQPNVTFAYHDLFADPIEGRFDLIVCSEVLYYAGDRERLAHAVEAIAGALAPRGRLVSAHANVLAEDPAAPGFDWDVPFGARTIAEAFAAAGLELERERSNPLYRLQSLRPQRRGPRLRRGPRTGEAPLPSELPRDVEENFHWDGAPAGREWPVEEHEPVTRELPILMYHRVAETGSERLHEWRVTPAQLEQQLHYLQTAGYRSATFDEWREAAERHQPLPGRRVLLTFDDGYQDFAEHAHPLLRRYGFEATVFLVSDRVGRTNEWDRHYGEVVPLMDWDTIRALDGDGVQFGGHTASHPMLTALGLEEVVREASRCRAALAEQLGRVPRAFAYPYGDVDAAVARTVGGCGFEFAVTTAGYAPSPSDAMLLLPRMNVAGTASFTSFVRMLTPRAPEPLAA
jgi:peptidoglycan/xylan/chitin deacetylase (PgdA/CDA1 family)